MTDSETEPTPLSQLNRALDRLRVGVPDARDELIRIANFYLERQTQRFLRPFPTVAAWHETGDIRQIALLRIHQSLLNVEIVDAQHFYCLIGKKVREVLLDLKRKLSGARGQARMERRLSDVSNEPNEWPEPPDATHDPQRLSEWLEIHSAIEALPQCHKAVFDLLWYGETSQDEAASILGISPRQLRRRWREAKLALSKSLPGVFGAP